MNELKINYNNDIYFKHLLSCNDYNSQLLREVITPNINDNHINEKMILIFQNNIENGILMYKGEIAADREKIEAKKQKMLNLFQKNSTVL